MGKNRAKTDVNGASTSEGTNKLSLKEERIKKVYETISDHDSELDINGLKEKVGYPQASLYRYIKVLEESGEIGKDEDGYYYVEEDERKDFEGSDFLKLILPNILCSVKTKRLPTFNKGVGDEAIELSKNNSLKTIVVEFYQRGYEQQIAEALYDEYIKEITLITVGVGGIIIYLRKNNVKSKIYSFLKSMLESAT